MSYKLKKFKSKNTHWIIIDLYNIYKREYDYLKKKVSNLNSEDFIKTLAKQIKNKILNLTNINLNKEDNTLQIILVNQIKNNNNSNTINGIWRKNIIHNWTYKFDINILFLCCLEFDHWHRY